jgi:hypothetical protein
VTVWNNEFTTVNITNNNIYTFTNNNRKTVKLSGMYKVKFSNTFFNSTYTDRANIRTIVSINGAADRTFGGQTACYIRHKNYAQSGTNSGAFILNLTVNDFIQLNNSITKAAAINYTSDFLGFRLYGAAIY